MSNNPQQRPFLTRAISASPLGVLALIGGTALAIVFLVRFQQILDDVQSDDLSAAIQALEITVFAVWLAVALWGWYLIRDGLDRVETKKRVEEQAAVLSRISETIADRDKENARKETQLQKSRSFWNWRSSASD